MLNGRVKYLLNVVQSSYVVQVYEQLRRVFEEGELFG
jgi:hypothetical protein